MLTENKTSGSTTQTTRYTYDANGNTLTKTSGATSEQYSYDGFNRLMKVVNGVGTTTYAYRPDGLRSSKTVAGVQTTHIWDGQDMSAELDKTGAVLRTYIRGIGLIAEDDAAGTRQYALYNAHGDVVQLTDKNGAVTKEYLYDAFGNERSPDVNDANPFRYCGEYFDTETGDIYLRARYYRPVTGRFMQMDSVWSASYTLPNEQNAINPLSLNLYTYCYNNPMRFFDPSGRITQTEIEMYENGEMAPMAYTYGIYDIMPYVPYKIGKLQIQGFSEPITSKKIKQSYHITQKAARSRPRAAFLRGKLGRRQKFSKK